MAETLYTLVGKITSLATAIHTRFNGFDKRLDGADAVIAELKTQIEAVDAKMDLVLETVQGLASHERSYMRDP